MGKQVPRAWGTGPSLDLGFDPAAPGDKRKIPLGVRPGSWSQEKKSKSEQLEVGCCLVQKRGNLPQDGEGFVVLGHTFLPLEAL